MTNAISPEVIANAPEGATHFRKSSGYYWRLGDGTPYGSFHAQLGEAKWLQAETHQEGLAPLTHEPQPVSDKPANSEPPVSHRADPQLGKGDAEGLGSFVPPAAPIPQNDVVRVSTLNRAWRWL